MSCKKILLTVALLGLGNLLHAAELDLSDCDVILTKPSAEYKRWLAGNTRKAAAGDPEAVELRAAVANNLLACHEEAVTGDAGWTVIETSPGKQGESVTKPPPGMPNIQKNPAALKALKEAFDAAHQAGVNDPGYKGMAATIAARYPAALADRSEAAYSDAASVYEFDCVLKRPFGRRLVKEACGSSRTARAMLLPLVTPERRQALDTAARSWAEKLPAKQGD